MKLVCHVNCSMWSVCIQAACKCHNCRLFYKKNNHFKCISFKISSVESYYKGSVRPGLCHSVLFNLL